MTPERRRTNWIPVALQTLVLLGAIIGFALANEHRITVLEECASTTSQNLKEALETVRQLQGTQVRVLTLLDEIEKRHQREDANHESRRR
jgi:hypothetical protein